MQSEHLHTFHHHLLAARRLVLLVLISCILLGGCDNAPDLEPTQDHHLASLSGSFLTENPDEINFPVKIVFAIDCSLSMGDEVLGVQAGSDPAFLRIEAVRNFIDEYNSNVNTSFEVMLWSTDVFSTTRTIDGARGFTKDPEELNRVLDGVYNDTMTDYLGTLDTIYADIERDIRMTENTDNLPRTKYIVVFLSDGMSNVQGGRQDDDDIWGRVTDLGDMVEEAGVGSFNFHTFLLLGGFPPTQSGQEARGYAETTLEGMAERGNGQFRLFDSAEAIDFINVVDMRLTVEYKIKFLLAYNYHVSPGQELVYIDSDGDGLSNDEEVRYGSDPGRWDSDDDGLGDYFEYSVSSPGAVLDPLVFDSPCMPPVTTQWPDTDSDGLTDCEEYVKGTNRRVSDTDRDGIPDGIEFRVGTSPFDVQETRDADFDGVVDWLEVQKHTNAIANDPIIRQRYAYYYDIRDDGLVLLQQGDDQQTYVRRYTFQISNIHVMDSGLAGHDMAQMSLHRGDNLIRLFIAQVPEDQPDSPPVFRMAEAIINFDDHNKDVVLTPSDFRLVP